MDLSRRPATWLLLLGTSVVWLAAMTLATGRSARTDRQSDVGNPVAPPSHESATSAQSVPAPVALRVTPKREAPSDAVAKPESSGTTSDDLKAQAALGAYYEDRFAHDRRSDAAASFESAIKAYFSSTELKAVQVESAECRGIICKLELGIPSTDPPLKIWGRGPFSYGGYFQRNEDGSTVAYVGMPNTQFPMADLASLLPESAARP